MLEILLQLGLFTAKSLIIVCMILIVLIVFFMLLAKNKEKIKAKLTIKNLSLAYQETTDTLLAETLSKKQLKRYLKEKKAKTPHKSDETQKNIFVLNFHGDIKASAVTALTEEVNAILNIATPHDEVVVRLESAGGIVSGYGLAAAQLMRIRNKNIPLTVAIDKVAASGGYMMACVANTILCAPFAIIGSIGVIVQLPNFHRLLKEKHIDFEQVTAGEFKRTLTVFGENTEAGKEKLKQEIEDIHLMFKDLISKHRQQININQVATGEYWLGQQAITLDLVDKIQTSDDYLLSRSQDARLFELKYEEKKPFLNRLSHAASLFLEKTFSPSTH
jgi:serine protease SohB